MNIVLAIDHLLVKIGLQGMQFIEKVLYIAGAAICLDDRGKQQQGQACGSVLACKYPHASGGGGASTSRLPLFSIGPTTPVNSMCSTMRAARL